MAHRIGTAAAVAVIAVYLGMVLRYVVTDGLLDHVESTVCCDAWLWASGHAIYPAPDAPERYAILYGPDVFIVVAASLKLLGPSIVAAKLPCAAAAILATALFLLAFRAQVGWRRSIWLAAIVIVGFACFRHITYWVRPDPFALLCASAALLAVTRGGRSIATITLAVATGICVNLKVHGLLYVLPLYALLYSRFDARSIAIAAVGALLVAMAPFAPAGVSLANYLASLSDATHHGLNVQIAWRVTLWVMLIFAAMIGTALAFHAQRSGRTMLERCRRSLGNDGGFGWLLIGSVMLIAIFASKAGAGPHHLIPLFPLVAYWCAAEWARAPAGTTRWTGIIVVSITVVAMLVMAVPSVLWVRGMERWVARNAIEGDLRALLAAYPDRRFHMGWGGEDYHRYTNARPVLVFANQPYWIDPVSVMDSTFAGRALSPFTIELVVARRDVTWLIPRGQDPFALRNPYDATRPLVPAAFRRTFVEHFHRDGSTKHFDLWVSTPAGDMTDKRGG